MSHTTPTGRRRRGAALASAVAGLVLITACQVAPPAAPGGGAEGGPTGAGPGLPTGPVGAVCDNTVPGPAEPPPGAVVVRAGVVGDLRAQVDASPPGAVFWLEPGTHTLTPDQYASITPRDGDTFLGAPGAVLDGRGVNQYAFVSTAVDVTVAHLVVTGFVPPADQGVVNHDSGDGWVIEHNTIQGNKGAGMMAGDRQVVRGNCLRANGQYGMNAYQPGNGITGLLVEGNEIVGNNTDDWEARVEGCGCTGGVKFWAVNGADVRGNWVHDNRGPGLWGDTNNNDFLVEGNVIEDNDGEALFYETSYNLVFRDNVVRRNAIVSGKTFAQDTDDFPVGSVYLSESGGEPRVPARTDRIEITGNAFEDNWSGITLWENADRFCNSAANTSTGNCTLLVPDVTACSQPAIASEPLYSDCRWKTQRVDIHGNTFTADPAVTGCAPGYADRMAVLSNVGTYPDWSPYQGDVVQQAIVRDQDVQWFDNAYVGSWTFLVGSTGRSVPVTEWQAGETAQDDGSTFSPGPGGC
ncbi:right-handed parallel beta-helix repeat-containing protein [Pseudonocardia broussonetiae]|uniref:Right-handed parallel beta-helix repeat-containing protein n=1 Tax=Pseudonocardia broussonetiae TaxID=2736640 RepID=A0A6M6JIN8_9PSEU|nr:right-handed parallel beta-helix repeat-containing protein [Pseudonocardia broussonetiae]QJY47035.1 right-handed parallel beta-helix repeat-containing protein [Pseudonocardia broussonetiae]